MNLSKFLKTSKKILLMALRNIPRMVVCSTANQLLSGTVLTPLHPIPLGQGLGYKSILTLGYGAAPNSGSWRQRRDMNDIVAGTQSDVLDGPSREKTGSEGDIGQNE